MKYADVKKEDERIRLILSMLQGAAKSQKALCREIGMTVPTFCRRIQDPGTLSLQELRNIKLFAKSLNYTFDPLEGVK